MIFPDLSRYDLVGVDTETTGFDWDSIPVGVSVATPDGRSWYIRWGHRDGGNSCTLAEAIRWSASPGGFRRGLTAVFLNAVYDLRMFKKVGISCLAVAEDAGVCAALLDEYRPGYSLEDLALEELGEFKQDAELNDLCAKRYGGAPSRKAQAGNYWKAPGDWVDLYARWDAGATLRLYLKLHPGLTAGKEDLSDIYELETRIIPVLVKMYFAGVKIDVPRARKVKTQLNTEYLRHKIEWDKLSGGFEFSKRNKMIELFDRLGIKYPRNEPTVTMKNAGKTVGNSRIDKSFLATLDHPVGAMIRRMRQVTHYRDTFIESYLLENLTAGDIVHPQFHSVKRQWGKDTEEGGTVTGRFSSAGGLNAQNIPARDEEWAKLIRGLFIPLSDEHQWLSCDYSQIEYRFFAHYAGGNMRKAYVDNPLTDFHEFVMELTGLSRKPAKNANFAKLYGAGIPKFALTAGCSEEEAARIMRIYDKQIPEAKILINKAMNLAARRGYVITWGGRVCRFLSVGFKQKKYLRTFTALNKVLQGSSADLTKAAMVAVDEVIDWDSSVMHLTVHDELDFSVPKGGEGVKQARLIKEVMQDFELTVPIIAEASLGPDWGNTTKLEDLAA